MSRKAKKRVGHPARRTREDKRAAWRSPSRRDLEIRDLVKQLKDHAYRHPGTEGALVAPIGVTANAAAAKLSVIYELDTHEHRSAISTYLVNKIGEVIDGFNPEDYLAWRDECVENLQNKREEVM